MFINIISVIDDFFYTWSSEVSSISPQDAVANSFIVAIEHETVLLVVKFISSFLWREYKVLEKPGSMSKMPFRWTDVHHRLNHIVFNTQR